MNTPIGRHHRGADRVPRYTLYARRIDRHVIQSDPKRADARHALHGRRGLHAHNRTSSSAITSNPSQRPVHRRGIWRRRCGAGCPP